MPLFACLGHFLLSLAAQKLSAWGGGVSPIWPANALILALILLRPRRDAAMLIAAGLAGNVLAVFAAGGTFVDQIIFATANAVELVIVTTGFKKTEERRGLFSDPKDVPHVLVWAGLLAPAASACIGALQIANLYHQPIFEAVTHWFLADALGLLIFTPLFLAILSGNLLNGIQAMDRHRRTEFAGLMALTAVIAALLLFLPTTHVGFLLIVPMMLVSFRTGLAGTKIALGLVATVAVAATLSGHGPLAEDAHNITHSVYGLQIFIATLILIQLPIAAAIAGRQSIMERLRESERSLRMLATRSPILLLSFSLEGCCSHVVGTSEPLLDRTPNTLVGRGFSEISEEGQFELSRAHEAALEDVSQGYSAEFRTTKLRDAWIEAVFRAHFDEEGRCIGTIATVHDITMRKNQELTLSRSATTDSLTGLLNRAGFRERLARALINAPQGSLSIAVLDVDRFKLINDNSGHQIGDFVLCEIARRIASQVRSCDAVGRLGGDEFVMLLSTPNWTMVQDICNRIVTEVNRDPVILPSGNGLRVAISCGVARLSNSQTVDEFIHEADTALYQAKRSGRNCVVAA